MVTIDIVQDFKDTTAIDAGDWSIEVEVFNSTNGWPRSVALNEGRSFWGGSKTFLSTAFMSRSGKPFDHKVTYEALPDEAAQATLEGKAVPVIHRISEFGDTFIFTAGGIFAVIPPAGEGITPDTFVPRRQDSTPAAAIAPVEIEEAGGFIMADEEGNALGLHELVWSETAQRYVAQDISVLAQSLMRTPVDMAARKGLKSSTSSVHIFIVNADDGSVAVFHSRRRQNVSGWTLWTTPGNSGTDQFQRVAVVGNQPYFIVKRTINGVVRYFLEKQVPGRFFDSSVTDYDASAKSSWAALAPHLVGETVKVWADGALRDDVVVGVGGDIVVTDGGEAFDVNTIEVGLQFLRRVETMPLEAQLSNGTLVGARHRIVEAIVKSAYDIKINGRSANFRQMQTMKLDRGLQPKTGELRVRPGGWKGRRSGPATVACESYLPMGIESITTMVSG